MRQSDPDPESSPAQPSLPWPCPCFTSWLLHPRVVQFIDHDMSKSTGGTSGDFVPIAVPKVRALLRLCCSKCATVMVVAPNSA